MTRINILKAAGIFAENKDIARDLRINKLVPAFEKGEELVIDFAGVEGATQSFIHALISDLIRNYGSEVLDKILFENCHPTIQKIITIVTDYMQES
jgi:hypothetical protein